jgi:hypothetical protein
MGKRNVTLEELSMDNVRKLSEKEVSDMLNRLISTYSKEKRPPYTTILSTSFEFKSIEAKHSELKEKMIKGGYKFFAIPYNSKLIMAVRKNALSEPEPLP